MFIALPFQKCHRFQNMKGETRKIPPGCEIKDYRVFLISSSKVTTNIIKNRRFLFKMDVKRKCNNQIINLIILKLIKTWITDGDTWI